jgi:cell division transport system permease protein
MIFFWIKEAFKSIGRAKSSFFLSLVSMSISVLLITASIFSLQLSNKFQSNLKRNINLNIFLDDTLSNKTLIDLQENLRNREYIYSIEYIDKEKAAKNFIQETGEDFKKILDYNPLPASFSVTLKDSYIVTDSLNKIVASISALSGVDEVIYKSEIISKIILFLNNFKKYVFLITIIILIVAVYIVYSTVRLVIRLKYDELETMKLVGAKLSTVKMPVILNGILIGLLAGIISSTIFSLFVYYLDNYIGLQKFLEIQKDLYLVILLTTGPIISLLVSYFSLRNITLKI